MPSFAAIRQPMEDFFDQSFQVCHSLAQAVGMI